MAEELGDWRPDGREGNRSGGGRGCGLVKCGSEILAERTVIGVDSCAFGPAVRLDV